MPEYEDLVRRALAAQERADDLQSESRQASELAALLREAYAGRVLLLHCAWCDRLNVGGEWLQLSAMGTGQQLITRSLRNRSTHGICPECLADQLAARARKRGGGSSTGT